VPHRQHAAGTANAAYFLSEAKPLECAGKLAP